MVCRAQGETASSDKNRNAPPTAIGGKSQSVSSRTSSRYVLKWMYGYFGTRQRAQTWYTISKLVYFNHTE